MYTNKKHILKKQLIELLGGKCIDCGQMPHFVAMDFDHKNTRTKYSNIADLLGKAANGNSYWMKAILEEVDKCELRCANCHRIKTFVNRDTGKRVRFKKVKHKL